MRQYSIKDTEAQEKDMVMSRSTLQRMKFLPILTGGQPGYGPIGKWWLLPTWLKGCKDKKQRQSKVGFYGLDLYRLWRALWISATKKDPALMSIAEDAFKCFVPTAHSVASYRNTRDLPIWGIKNLDHDSQKKTNTRTRNSQTNRSHCET
jgi:hypothetical protein